MNQSNRTPQPPENISLAVAIEVSWRGVMLIDELAQILFIDADTITRSVEHRQDIAPAGNAIHIKEV